jgi:mono/diheme cytochrome c family protein/uncharacterized membrane protein
MDRFYSLLEAIGYPHPVHPQFTHITIGMVFGACVLGLLSLLLRSGYLRRAARYCAVIALVAAFVTGFFGVADWQHFFAGGWLGPVKAKLVLACVLVIPLAASLIVARHSNSTSGMVFALYLLSLLAVVGLGYFGGNLVYDGRTPPGGPQYLAGEHAFRGNCSGCHPYGANIAAPSFPLRGAPQLKDFPSFLGWIRDPRLSPGFPGIMPAFPRTRVSDEQATRLYAYVINVIGGVPQTAAGPERPITVRSDPDSVKRGQALFTANCARCHTTGSTETVVGPGLKGVLKRPRLPASGRPATPGNVFGQLRTPYRAMPSFQDKLSDDQVSDLIAYLATQ